MTPLDGHRPLRIAMLAPPWIPVPAPGYGGIEEVVRLLCDGLSVHGHEVTLYAPPGSSSRASVVTLLDETHPDDIQIAQFEADHWRARSARSTRRPSRARRST